MRVRYLLTAIALALATGSAYSFEPPAAPPVGPPAAPAVKPAVKPVCVCGDDCKCKPGECPGKCPVGAKSPKDSVVYVSVDLGNGSSAGGTGTVIASENGRSLILTNAHVVENAEHPISVTYWSDGKPYKTPVAYVNGSAVSHVGPSLISIDGPDLALLELAYPLPAVTIADTIPATGASVSLYGFGGAGPYGTTPLYKTGLYYGDSPSRTSAGDPICQTGIITVNGDSGSGIFDEQGQLVAVHWGGNGSAVRLDTIHTFTVTTLKSKRVLFPKLHDKLAAKKIAKAAAASIKEPPAAKPVVVAGPTPIPSSCPNSVCPASGSCPGGNCPNQSYGRRGFFFRR